MGKFKLTLKIAKKVGKELEEILNPTDDDGEAISLTKGKLKALEPKLKEACEALTTSDTISEELEEVIEYFEIEIPEPEEDTDEPDDPEDDEELDDEDDDTAEDDGELDEEDEPEYDWDTISSMNRKDLKEICEEEDLVTDPDDYDKDSLDEFRKDIAIELKIEVPDDEEEPEEEEEELELPELVQSTTKLADLKEICEENDEFKSLRKKLKKYKGMQGPRELKAVMLKKLGVEPVKPKPKAKKKKGPGVIASIVEFISEKPVSKETILKKLTKRFPERNPDSMKKTINVQVPNRIKKEKNESLTKKDNGKWFFKKTVGDIKKTA